MLLLKNGCVHDGMLNVFSETDILIDGGKIKAIGKNLSAEGGEVIDVTGKHVFPGFVSAVTEWGVTGPDWTSADNKEISSPAMPELNIVYGFDHDGMNYQHVFEYGVTTAGVTPANAAVLGGQGAVFKTFGRSPYDMLIKEHAFMHASASPAVKAAFRDRGVAPMTMMGVFSILEEQFKKGTEYKEGPDSKARAMKKVTDGDMPLFINCPKRAQMDAVIEFLKDYPNVKPVITAAYGLDTSYAPLKEGRVSVLMGDFSEIFEEEKGALVFDEVIKLMESDLPVAISVSGDSVSGGKENLLWNAILYIKHGLCPERALRAITHMPAKILGVDNRVGAIACGLDANLSVWSANPFVTYQANCEATFIEGEDVLRKERYVSCW